MPRWLVPAVAAATVVPLVAALVAQRHAHWHPVFDLAMTELRVRDVGGRHTPLIGLQGRIGPSGSHPGPLSFYLLAPVYRLLGSSAFALQAATVGFHAGAAVSAIVVAARHRDGRIVVAIGAVLLLLEQGYGLGPLTEPWNPHLPVLWFVLFLVAGWAVADGDLPMLVPLVIAGSICAQTHVPYLALTLGLGVAAAVVAVVRLRAGQMRRWRPIVAAGLIGVLLWVPPIIDEAIHDPGNLSQIIDHLGTPSEPAIGGGEAMTRMLERLDAWQLLVVESRHPGTYFDVLGSPGPTQQRGAVTLAVWLACVGAAALLRRRRLLILHGVVGCAIVVGTVTISRIYGAAWPYLMTWGFGIGGLLVASIAATVVALAAHMLPTMRIAQSQAFPGAVGLTVIVALSARLLLLAPDATTGTPDQTKQLRALVPPTVDAIERGVGVASGHRGRYLVVWDDVVNGGSEGIGLVNELIRRDYDVGVGRRDGVRIGRHRVRERGDATAQIVVASGGWIDQWSVVPGVVRVAYDDPRTSTERIEFDEARAAVIAELDALGRDDLIDRVDTDLFGVALNEGLPPSVGPPLGRMLDIGVPIAVFVVPAEVHV